MNRDQTTQITASQTTVSVLAAVLSFLASQHHLLHMLILTLLGGSTTLMATMSTMLWVRRFMIVMTCLTVGWSVWRLFKHRCTQKRVMVMTAVSVILSLGFVVHTLITFGW